MEEAASQIKMQSKEEQRQLREALTEANKVLRRENLLGTSAVDDRERIVLEEKFKEIEENHKIAEKKLLEARSENAKLKADMHHGFAKDEKREGRGLHNSWLSEEDQSRLKEDLRYEENEVDRLRGRVTRPMNGTRMHSNTMKRGSKKRKLLKKRT